VLAAMVRVMRVLLAEIDALMADAAKDKVRAEESDDDGDVE
jgi:hypothetical protein